jgi:hypothetical protein
VTTDPSPASRCLSCGLTPTCLQSRGSPSADDLCRLLATFQRHTIQLQRPRRSALGHRHELLRITNDAGMCRGESVPRELEQARPERPSKNRIPNMINIAKRPAEADDRVVPGHWESSRHNTAISRWHRVCVRLGQNCGKGCRVAALTQLVIIAHHPSGESLRPRTQVLGDLLLEPTPPTARTAFATWIEIWTGSSLVDNSE